jgi:hypothetical protein
MPARITVLLVLFTLSGCAAAGAQTQQQSFASSAVGVKFTPTEIEIIRDYYEAGSHKKKGGKTGLPPGIAKNLARGKPLPPGIAKQYLPGDLVRRLPPVPAGYERIVVAGKILLVEIATQIVHDVLTDVLFD